MEFSNTQIFAENLPKIDTINLKPISRHYLKIIFFNRLFIYIILLGLLFVLKTFIEEDGFQHNFWYVFVTALGVCFINLVIALLAFKKRKYAVREQDLVYAKGLIVNYLTTVPISRIQHVEVSRSWLERYLNLASLKIFTAGEAGGDLKINGLSNLEAQQINDFISSQINGDS